MLNIDFKAHNSEVQEMWENYRKGSPNRVPIIVGMNPRMILLNPELNKKNITFKEYFDDPEVMLNVQLEFQYWSKHNIIQDFELGVPEKGWDLMVDFQNISEAAWLGCPIKYFEGQVPDTDPILHEDNKNMLFDKGIPDPFSGAMGSNIQFYEHFMNRAKTLTFHGKPIKYVEICAAYSTDGPLTVASNLRGATEIMMDMYEDPDYVHQLLNFITEATIQRLRAQWTHIGWPIRMEKYRFADDSAQSISTEMYKEFVLPCHKRLVQELGGAGPFGIHLCGDATHHFKLIRDELNVYEFDTGFPIDFGKMREELGKDVTLVGGPNVRLLRYGSPNEIREEVKKILESGVMEGGNFRLREGNNLAPCTPIENIEAMYYAGREFGKH